MIDRALAGIISFFVPGLGQILQGESYKGGVLLLIAIILWVLGFVMGPFYGPYFFGILTIYAIIIAINAYKIE
ncbi:MAG: hypothetical protein Q4P18_07405 [Methanobrevibacter sp.]|uniref:hypothetical protein n=1 Tax=Methanobrevibacter sp. TaxID=66852 RepID=UPI0026E023BB|nr:hypothetical protein [Methanobrevibacter sp.]MDO5849345.1 hypothetical protein [Methanobrevibacter sp.]